MSLQCSSPENEEAGSLDQSKAKNKHKKIYHSFSEPKGINGRYVGEPVFHEILPRDIVGGPGALCERCDGRGIGGIIRLLTYKITERANDIILVQLVAASECEFECGGWRAGLGRTCGL